MLLASVTVIGSVSQTYLTQLLTIRWRRWVTAKFLDGWLCSGTFYKIGLLAGETVKIDNPDQRIAEDISIFCDATLGLSLQLVSRVISFCSFVTILWGLSGVFEVFGISIPGYLFWVALLYVIMSTTITHFAGRKLALLDFRQQRVEADFRSSLVRVRENAEAIAMHGGEGYEKGLLLDYFGDIVLNWLSIMRRTTLVNFVGGLYGQGGTILPILVLAPRYFIGEATLGTIFQTNEAFGRIENSLSWIIDVYGQLARLRSVVDRLSNFDRAITAAQTSVEGLVRVQSTDEAIRVSDLDLCLPQGMRLLERLHLSMDPGHSVLLSGPSGSAKSTLFRLISGIWPFARGRIEVPADMFFLPQRTYMAIIAHPPKL